MTFPRKMNSNFTPTGCVAQLCENAGIIREEMTWLRGTESATSPHWAEPAGSRQDACTVSLSQGIRLLLQALEILISALLILTRLLATQACRQTALLGPGAWRAGSPRACRMRRWLWEPLCLYAFMWACAGIRACENLGICERYAV